MVSVIALIGLTVIVGIHTLIAAVLTRIFRVQLATRWGTFLFTVTVIPVVLFISTLIISGLLGLGPNLGGPGPAILIMIGAPLGIGVAFDYLWMPAPDEVELPETMQ